MASGLDLPEGVHLPGWRARLRQHFADQVYGPLPPRSCPKVTRHAIAGETAERLNLTLRHQGKTMHVDAAMWRAVDGSTQRVIVVLDFLGPVGCMTGDFPIDPKAVVAVPSDLGGGTRLTEALRGTTAHRVPVKALTKAGYAVLVSCYGSWTPDCPKLWREAGTGQLFQTKTGAISLWAWGFQRLTDVAKRVLGAQKIVLAGHSRLGKAALWAGALDMRVDGVFANQSGCFGAALHAHPEGETAEQLIKAFPHWVIAQGRPALDQHLLLALLAPRKVYLGQSREDRWADPEGSLWALRAAGPAWGAGATATGFHMRDGAHELLEEDWQQFLDFNRGCHIS